MSPLVPVFGIDVGGLPQVNDRVAMTVRVCRSVTVRTQVSWTARTPLEPPDFLPGVP